MPSTMRMWTPSVPTPTVQPPKSGAKKGGRKSTGKPGGGKSRPLWLTLIKWGSIVCASGILLLVATVAFVFWMYGRDPNLPDIEKLSDYQPRQVTLILDGNGQRVGELYGKTGALVKELESKLDDPALDEQAKRDLKKKIEQAKKDTVERRTFVAYEKVPEVVVNAFVAAEDTKFWTHGGIDYWGMFRAFIQNLRAGKTKQGASTITQQVVKNLLLTPERTFKRKIQEIILARRLENSLSKQEIITLYMNEIYFGHKRYGVQEASRYFFGKDVGQLNPGEAAVLGALPKEPETLANSLQALRGFKKGDKIPADVMKKAQRVKDRQIYVLNNLLAMGKISQEDAQRYIDEPIHVAENPFPKLGSAPEWVQLVRNELVAGKCPPATGKDPKSDDCPEGEAYLDKLGATVRTTLDPKLQQDAQRALQKNLRAFDERHGAGRPVRVVAKDKIDDEIASLAKKLGGTPNKTDIYEAVVTNVHDSDQEIEVDLGNWKAGLVLTGAEDTRFSTFDENELDRRRKQVKAKIKDASGARKQSLEFRLKGLEDAKPDTALSPAARFRPGDVVEVMAIADPKGAPGKPAAQATKHAAHRVVWPQAAEGAIVVLDVKTRKVRALVGGYSSKIAGFNRATDAHRQPGSSFKPFVYAAAIERGANKGRDLGNTEFEYTAATRRNDTAEFDRGYIPKNYESGHFEGPILLRHALAKSINTISVIITERLTASVIASLAQKMGIKSHLPSTDSIALGSGEVTPLEMTNAVATLAAGGKTAPPKFIDAVDGKATDPAQGEQAIAPEVAYVVTNMMTTVVSGGTGYHAKELGIPVAGKTGTSNDARDVWFIGLTPDYAIGVWVGYDNPRTMGRETGGEMATPIFVDVVKTMSLPAKQFPRPPHVVEVKIDRKTGLLPAEGAANDTTTSEVFVDGTQPTLHADKEGDITEKNQFDNEFDKKKDPDAPKDVPKDKDKDGT